VIFELHKAFAISFQRNNILIVLCLGHGIKNKDGIVVLQKKDNYLGWGLKALILGPIPDS
jgi:hypothetical protein